MTTSPPDPSWDMTSDEIETREWLESLDYVVRQKIRSG